MRASAGKNGSKGCFSISCFILANIASFLSSAVDVPKCGTSTAVWAFFAVGGPRNGTSTALEGSHSPAENIPVAPPPSLVIDAAAPLFHRPSPNLTDSVVCDLFA